MEERKGKLTAVGTQVQQGGDAIMYVEINGIRINCPSHAIITVKVED